LKHECAHDVVEDEHSTLSLAVLLRSVRTREAEGCTIGGQKCVHGGVYELGAIVCLERAYSGAKLSASVREKNL
jgi:hypothetical protein